jgi:hypothetical protein
VFPATPNGSGYGGDNHLQSQPRAVEARWATCALFALLQ